MPYVLLFKEITPPLYKLVGEKASSLASLYLHHNVPPGFVITPDSYSYFLEKSGIRNTISKYLSRINDKNVQETANEIQKTIIGANIPKEIAAYILEAYSALGVAKKMSASELISVSESANAAVRSSYFEELKSKDLTQLTMLNVKGEKRLLEAIKVAWAALYTAKNIMSRQAIGAPIEASTAVIVQKMVDAEKSIISYSFNPKTNNNSEIYVQAINGLGEGFSNEAINPDVYVLDKKDLFLKEAKVGWQAARYELDKESGKTVKLLSKDEGRSQKLQEKETREAARITKKIALGFGKDQRVELVLSDGQFYVLQAKSVSTKKEDTPQKPVVYEVITPAEEAPKLEVYVVDEPKEGFGENIFSNAEIIREEPKAEDAIIDKFEGEAEKFQAPLIEKKEERVEINPDTSAEAAKEKPAENVDVLLEDSKMEISEKEDFKVYEEEPDPDVLKNNKEKAEKISPSQKPSPEEDEEWDDSIFSSVKDGEEYEEER